MKHISYDATGHAVKQNGECARHLRKVDVYHLHAVQCLKSHLDKFQINRQNNTRFPYQ